MNTSILHRLATVTAVAALVLSTSCSNPAASVTNDTNKTGGTVDTSKVGFEGTLTAGNFTAPEADVQGGTMAMVFAADSVRFNTGAQSLLVTGTSRQNAYSSDFFGELNLALGSLAPVDFTGKTLSVAVYVPTGSSVAAVNVTLMNASGLQELLHEQGVTAGQWNTLTFANSPVDYADTGATFTGIQTLRFRFETRTGTTPVSAAVSVNLDSVSW